MASPIKGLLNTSDPSARGAYDGKAAEVDRDAYHSRWESMWAPGLVAGQVRFRVYTRSGFIKTRFNSTCFRFTRFGPVAQFLASNIRELGAKYVGVFAELYVHWRGQVTHASNVLKS